MDRFKTLSYEQLMDFLQLPDILRTRCGRDIYDKGMTQGMTKGMSKGMEKASHDLANLLARKRLGTAAVRFAPAIGKLKPAQVRRLVTALVDMSAASELRAWLAKVKT